MNNNNEVNVVICGGGGKFCRNNYLPTILKSKEEGIPVNVPIIIDLFKNPNYDDNIPLKEIIKKDAPALINASELEIKLVMSKLNSFIDNNKINLFIVSTYPEYHEIYSALALQKKIRVLCDKPPVVEENISSDVAQVSSMIKKFEDLRKHSESFDSSYGFTSALRRRGLDAYNNIAELLKYVFQNSGQGITRMLVNVNGGLHRFPAEFLLSGSHGYTKGFGSLCHSAYHYLDLISWYLQSAPGNIYYLDVSLTYINRIKDYLAVKGWRTLHELLNQELIESKIDFPNNVLNAELDTTFV